MNDLHIKSAFDRHGARLSIGDLVWLEWSDLGALARIVGSSCERCGSPTMVIAVVPGSISHNGELVDHTRQNIYTMRRSIEDSGDCVLLQGR